MRLRRTCLPAIISALLILGSGAGAASAEGLEDDGGASWRVEQPEAPTPPPGVPRSPIPIGLGKIGDIEFQAPNRGLLITAGNPPTIPPGIWVYNGVSWRELATVCGASDGRIAWAGANEFWTISDGRPGQASTENGVLPPLTDNTLCHFDNGKVETSYASLAFRADSYQAMHATSCISTSDCWFGGDPLPDQPDEAFQLHWNGSSLSAEPYPHEGHTIEDMGVFDGRLFESVRLSRGDQLGPGVESEPPVLHLINPTGQAPVFTSLPAREIPLYGTSEENGEAKEEFPEALDFLHLSAGEDALWAATGPQGNIPEGSAPGQVTVVRDSAGHWSQLVGPAAPTSGAGAFPGDVVDSIASEPQTESAWIAVEKQSEAGRASPTAPAVLARISAGGVVSDEQQLGRTGAAEKVVCPAVHDCWMATTAGWLYHLAPEGERQLPEDTAFGFSTLITERPPDSGLPRIVPDAPPVDDSGLLGEPPPVSLLAQSQPNETRVTVPLVTHVRTRVVHGTMLELRFHLAVRARVRLIAKRRKSVVASSPTRILAAGNRSLLLRLKRSRWPTSLSLQTHALAKLPTASTREAGTNVVGTNLRVLPSTPTFTGSESLS